jgi:hypothetical protein
MSDAPMTTAATELDRGNPTQMDQTRWLIPFKIKSGSLEITAAS